MNNHEDRFTWRAGDLISSVRPWPEHVETLDQFIRLQRLERATVIEKKTALRAFVKLPAAIPMPPALRAEIDAFIA